MRSVYNTELSSRNLQNEVNSLDDSYGSAFTDHHERRIGTTGTMNEAWLELSVRLTQMFEKMFKVGVVDPGDAGRTVGG